MRIYCIEDFKEAYEKLITKDAYKKLEKDIIQYFFNKTFDELCSGTRLNARLKESSETPYIKKRLGGSGGYRVYFLAIVKDENLYLMFVHPKTGKMGSSNITDESKTYLYEKVFECIRDEQLYHLHLNEEKNSIVFEAVSKRKER